MTVAVQIPTETEVRAACERFDRENDLAESALSELLRHYPDNSDARAVLLKVVAINTLYHTSIFDVVTVARHIHAHAKQIDAALTAGSPEIVDMIAKVKIQGRTYCFLAFATKYCSWHNPESFPIYDAHIDRYLMELQKHGRFATFQHADLYDYPKFRKIMESFQDFYKLGAFSYKELDKFLFLQGVRPAAPTPDPVPCGPGAFDFYSGDEQA